MELLDQFWYVPGEIEAGETGHLFCLVAGATDWSFLLWNCWKLELIDQFCYEAGGTDWSVLACRL